MERTKRSLFVVILITLILIAAIAVSCSEDDDPNQPPPAPGGGGGEVSITTVEGGHMFWGDEMTITGTGFSANKAENIVKLTKVSLDFCGLNYTSAAGGVIEIVSATATQLKVKIPYKQINNVPVCGPERATLEITVNGTTAKKEGVKFNALPTIGEFNYHYGWFDIPSVTRIGDSVMIDGGMKGYFARESDLWNQTKLTIDGSLVDIKFRTIGLESGWAFFLPVEDYGEVSCSDEPDGWAPARKMNFTLSVANKSASIELYVQYLPSMNVDCQNCPGTTAQLNPADPSWKITGKNIYYSEARFVPMSPCGGSDQGVLLNKETFDNEFTFQIPLAILTSSCQYGVYLTDHCDRSELIGFFTK